MEREEIILLASYPRTGSTWLKLLMAELVAAGTPVDSFMPSFGKTLPETRTFAISGHRYHFLKTHMHPHHPDFAQVKMPLAAIISIRRHPLDILLSSLNYALIRKEPGCFLGGELKSVAGIVADGEMPHYLDEFIAADGFPWYRGRTGPFSLFQRSWRAEAERARYLELCYEDMVAAPQNAVGWLASFLGIEADAAKIKDTIRIVDGYTRKIGAFYWMRRARNFETFLPRELSQNFERRYKPVLDELGYGVG